MLCAAGSATIPERWTEFRRRYAAELAKQPALLAELRSLARHATLTLVYGARDEAHNNAVVLREALSRAARKTKTPAGAKPTAGVPKRKSDGISTRRAASRRVRR